MNNKESNLKSKERCWWLFSNINSFCTLSIPSQRARRREGKIPSVRYSLALIANETIFFFTYFGDGRFSSFWSKAKIEQRCNCFKALTLNAPYFQRIVSYQSANDSSITSWRYLDQRTALCRPNAMQWFDSVNSWFNAFWRFYSGLLFTGRR